MKRVALLVIVLVMVLSVTVLARYDLDGVRVITSAYIHTASGDFQLDMSRKIFNVYSETGLNAFWKEICETAQKNGCTLHACDKIVVFFKDYCDVEKVAILSADRTIMASEIMNNFSTFLLM